jgi:pilus assembly protein CpaB
MQIQKQQIYLLSGIALSLAALFMIKVYLDQQRRSAEQAAASRFKKMQASQASVLVAKKDIPKGTIVDTDNFDASIVPNQFVQPGAVTSLDRVSGMMAIVSIAKGEQVTLSKLAYPRQAGGLAEVIPSGKRAITISVDNISSLAGMVKAGDNVDVIAMIPQAVPIGDGKTATQLAVLPMFQNVLILAVGQETTAVQKTNGRYRKEIKQETNPLITLALTPQEASLIAFVQEQGKIRLTLRSPADSKIEPVQPASWDALMQYLYPRAEQAPVVHPPEDYVEIYRGTSKEKVLIAK